MAKTSWLFSGCSGVLVEGLQSHLGQGDRKWQRSPKEEAAVGERIWPPRRRREGLSIGHVATSRAAEV